MFSFNLDVLHHQQQQQINSSIEGYINVNQHNSWPQQHNLPRTLTNMDSRAPIQKVQYSSVLIQEQMATIN